jgi:hypothetical protein
MSVDFIFTNLSMRRKYEKRNLGSLQKVCGNSTDRILELEI